MSAKDDLDRQRAARLAADTRLARKLTGGYRGSWQKIRAQLNILLADIEVAKKRGDTIDQGWLARRGHVETLSRSAVAETRVFVEFAKRTISPAVMDAYRAGAIDAEMLVRSSLPPGLPWTPALPVDETVRIAQAMRPGLPLGNLLDELPGPAAQAARDTLIQGVALGHGTRRIAADMRDAFGGDLVRALRISRTETIGAYRRSALARYQSASNVVAEWVWVAALNARTCAACIAQHGSIHPLDEAFASHPVCRCSPAPRTRSWAELGFEGIPETRIDVESGETWFARQPAAFQKQILGPGKHTAYVEGRIKLADLVEPTVSPVWGAGMRERSLRSALLTSGGNIPVGARVARPTVARSAQPLRVRASSATVESVERSIRNLPIEHAAVFDDAGKLILRKTGTADSVVFTAAETAKLKGSVLTHNHPLGGSFSASDVSLAARMDIREIRAVSSLHTFSLGRPTDGWPGLSDQEIHAAWDSAKDSVVTQIREMRRAGSWPHSLDDSKIMAEHEVMLRVSKQLGATYKRTTL